MELQQGLDAMLSPDNGARDAAEAAYRQRLKERPAEVALFLAETASAAQGQGKKAEARRDLTLVLLRSIVRGEHWLGMPVNVKLDVQKRMVSLIEGDRNPKICTKAVNVLVALPQNDLRGMSDIVPWIVRCAASATDSSKRCVYLLFLGKLAEFCMPLVEAELQNVLELLKRNLHQDQDLVTKLFTAEAICQVLLSSNKPQEMRPFTENCIVEMVKSVAAGFAIEASPAAHDQASETIMKLDSLSNKCMWAFESSLQQICLQLLQIADNASLDANSRSQALNMFVELARKRAHMILGDASLRESILKLMLRMQCEDDEWFGDWSSEHRPIVDDMLMSLSPGMRGNALVSLGTLAFNIKDKEGFMKQAFSIAGPALQSNNFKERHAAATTIGVLAEPLGEQMKGLIRDILSALSGLFQDRESSVRFIALAALHQLIVSPGLKGAFREQNANVGIQVLQLLLQILEDKSADNAVLACACKCLESFMKPDLFPFEELEEQGTKRLLQALVARLQHSHSAALQEDALLALGEIASVSGSSFGAFYDELVPGIKHIIAVTSQEEHQQQQIRSAGNVRAAAMSCIAAIAEAVGKEKFMGDAKAIMRVLLETNPDDLMSQDGVFDFCKRVCAVLGDDFVPFLPHVLPIIYRAVQAKEEVELEDVADSTQKGKVEQAVAASLAENNGVCTVVQEVRGAGTYRIRANVFVLQIRTNALDALDSICETIGPNMGPYLEEAISVVLPVISEKMNVFAAAKAAESSASLLHAAWKSLYEQGHSMEPAQKLLVTICTAILTGLEQASMEDDDVDPDDPLLGVDQRNGFASAFERCMRICYFSGGEDYNEDGSRAEPELTPPAQLVPQLVNVLRSVAQMSVQRRDSMESKLHAKGFEPEAIADFLEEMYEMEEEFMTDVIDSIGYLLKMLGPHFVPTFDAILHPLLQVLLKNRHEVIKHNAICLYDDIIEFGGEEAHKYLDTCLPVMLASIRSDNEMLQQSSIYGIGQVALHAPQRLAQDGAQVVQLVTFLIQRPAARSEEKLDVTENAVSVLGKIYKAFGASDPKAANIVNLWLENLPLKKDMEEARFSHRLLLELIEKRDPNLMGTENANVPRLLTITSEIMANVIANEKLDEDEAVELVDKASENALPETMRTLFKTLSDDAQRNAVISSLTPEQRRAAESIF